MFALLLYFISFVSLIPFNLVVHCDLYLTFINLNIVSSKFSNSNNNANRNNNIFFTFRKKAELNMEGQFLIRQIYDDEITYNLIGAAVEILSK